MSDNFYERLGDKRKQQQEEGVLPEWYTTGGLQLFEDKYLYECNNVKEQWERISKTLAVHAANLYGRTAEIWEYDFFKLLWNGWLSPSTPVFSNTGTSRGMSVSCSGGDIPDSIHGFYSTLLETTLLTQEGFGTSGNLDGIRPRGSKIRRGGKASGVIPVLNTYVQAMRDVAQGTARRGAWAGYIGADHGDFYEVANEVLKHPDDLNIGWTIKDSFIEKLNSGDPETLKVFQRMMKVKCVTGKGYFFFKDKANRKRPESYIRNSLDVKASNLCSEIMLHSSDKYTFTCVLSSMNLAKWDEWKDTDAVFLATVFLDCVAEDFIQKAKKIPGLEKAVAFTERGRALGLGVCGFHTYLQENLIPFESLEAMYFNAEAFKRIKEEAERATAWMASLAGEPEWCEGLGRRNTHLMAVAPTKSTALLMGGVSEGINPDPAMTYTQNTAAGEVNRVNQSLLKVMKARGKNTKKVIDDIADHKGSVQHVDWLSPEEKLVFKTAFEINQEAVIRLASQRAKWLDQWQSLNLFFPADASEAYISRIHEIAFKDPNILALYYCYFMTGVQGAKEGECIACQ